MARKQWAEPIKGGEFEGRELHGATQLGGPLSLVTGAGTDLKFRGRKDAHFGGPGAARRAPEGALKQLEMAECPDKCALERLQSSVAEKSSRPDSLDRSPDCQKYGFTE